MTMKKTELEKRAGLKVAHRMKQAAARSQPKTPGRDAQHTQTRKALATQLIERALTPTPNKTEKSTD